MVSLKELTFATYGIAHIIRNDNKAPLFFGCSALSVYHSFFAVLMSLPTFVYKFFIDSLPEVPRSVNAIIFYMLVYIIGWVLWPVVVFRIFDKKNKKDLFSYLTAYNWLRGFETLFSFPLAFFMQKGIEKNFTVAFFSTMLIFIFVRAQWFTAKCMLKIEPKQAFGVVITDLFFRFVLIIFAASLIGIS